MEKMGKWHNDNGDMFAALVQKVTEIHDALQQMYSSATTKSSGDINNNEEHKDNNSNKCNNKICKFL